MLFHECLVAIFSWWDKVKVYEQVLDESHHASTIHKLPGLFTPIVIHNQYYTSIKNCTEFL